MRHFVLLTCIALTSAMSTPGEPSSPIAQDGFGGGFSASFGVPVSSSDLTIVAPRSRDSLAAWSHHTGVWSRIPIKPKKDESVVPIVGTGVAAARVGKMVYGYGAEAGKWHWIETETEAIPSVGTGRVTVQDGDWYYLLSSKSGKWSGINLETGEIR